MKKLGAIVAVVFACACMAMVPAAQAWDETDHVYEAPNGVGDALIFPVYLASGTFKTNIRVINTSCEFAVVAKVVFREGISSCEVRDFLIYLTPNDMWTADIVDLDGVVTIVSDDDSSPVVPLSVPIAESCNGYPGNLGYIEVYEAYAFANFDDVGCDLMDALICWGTPIPKTDLKLAYQEAASNYFLDGCYAPADCLSWVDEDEVLYDHAQVWLSQPVLAGVEELTDPSFGLVMPMVATALTNNCNDIKLNVQEETRWDNYGNNTAFEVRAALAKENVHIPFRADSANATFALFNFPAKLSCCASGSEDCDGVVDACVSAEGDECLNCDSAIDPDTDCEHRVEFQTTWDYSTYDLEENTPRRDDPVFSPVPPEASKPPMRNEVMLFSLESYAGSFDITGTYTEGWVRMTLTDACVQRHGLTLYGDLTPADHYVWYNGSAVIPTYLQIGADLSWVPATYDCGTVVVTDVSPDSGCPVTSCPQPMALDCMSLFENCSYQATSKNLTPWAGCDPICGCGE